MPTMTGARFIAETVHGYGLTPVFFMPYIAPRALMEASRSAPSPVAASKLSPLIRSALR